MRVLYCLLTIFFTINYHDASARIATRDWDDVFVDLQLGNIPDADMPRLLFDSIRDGQKWRGNAQGLLKEIESLQARAEQYKGD